MFDFVEKQIELRGISMPNTEMTYTQYGQAEAKTKISISPKVSSKSKFYYSFKRLMDILLCVIGLVVAIPIMLIAGIAIKIDSKGPIIYKQERMGKDGKVFIMYKLRSMCVDAEKNGAKWADKNDPRITRVGNFIRKTRIDELPQLFNIIKGDMSIVGPRPERPMFTYKFNEEIPGFINRLQVKPGLTGWAQVNGGYNVTPRDKWEKDMYYIENQSILMDIKILFKTVAIVFTGNGAR